MQLKEQPPSQVQAVILLALQQKEVEKLIILYNCLSGFLSYFIILGTEQHAVANGSIKSYLTFKWAMIGQGVDNKEDSYSEMFVV